jgi:GTP-binding protein HflX
MEDNMSENKLETKERIIVVGMALKSEDAKELEISLDELEELAQAADGEVVGRLSQSKERVDVRSFIGKGKLEELAELVKNMEVDTVVFNDELSGAQIRNIEAQVECKVIDRTGLILDIFARRAVSKEGKLQVELAQHQYRLPRLTGLGVSLSRMGAGIGTRGPGETKLEMDRRHILERVTEIKRQLKQIEKTREINRKQRLNSSAPIVALVGYTNAGKSTLMNQLAKLDDEFEASREVFVQDMLFATLDTTLRKSKLNNGKTFLVTDTVGFVSKLPTNLVEAFKGTLEEVVYADLILHVMDLTNEKLDLQRATTEKILKELGCEQKEQIVVYNKVDVVENIEELKLGLEADAVYLSAKSGEGLDVLLDTIEKRMKNRYYSVRMILPYDRGDLLSYFHDSGDIQETNYIEDGIEIKITLNEEEYNRYQQYVAEKYD